MYSKETICVFYGTHLCVLRKLVVYTIRIIMFEYVCALASVDPDVVIPLTSSGLPVAPPLLV